MAETIDRNEMPFVAPCRQVSPLAPFRWLARGVGDLRAAPRQSLAYGGAVAVLTAVVTTLAWLQGSQWILFAIIGGFVFMAPLCCVGLYAISAQIERGQPPLLARSLKAAFRRHLGNEMVFALVLMVIFMIWARSAFMVTAFFPMDSYSGSRDLLAFLGFGSAIGAVFAAVTFSASAFSLPMLMHRDVDSITAIVTSINAVLRNKLAMLVWLVLIVALLLIGIATLFLGLVLIVPVIGYGVWHAYMDTIDAEAFPRHEAGITSTPRDAASLGEL